jgi:N6-adenosine-specific RNA methylase IME4
MGKKINKGFLAAPISRVLSAIFGNSVSHYNHCITDLVISNGVRDGLKPAEKEKIAELVESQRKESNRKVDEFLSILKQVDDEKFPSF